MKYVPATAPAPKGGGPKGGGPNKSLWWAAWPDAQAPAHAGTARLVALMATLPVPGEEPQDFWFRLWQADDAPICCSPTCGTNCCAPSTGSPWPTSF